MSRRYKCLALISQWSYFSANRRDFFMAWIGPDYPQVWPSKCHGDTCLAQFSLVLSRSCQPNYRRLSPWLVTFMSRWLASFFMAWIWPMPCRDFSYGHRHTTNSHRSQKKDIYSILNTRNENRSSFLYTCKQIKTKEIIVKHWIH